MFRPRVIPVLLVADHRLFKTVRFGDRAYIGDPVNAIRIFNEKWVDEILVLDIDASRKGRAPDFDHVQKLSAESLMPFGYGGGVSNVEHVERLVRLGVEKVSLNTGALRDLSLVSEAADAIGSQSVMVSIDVTRRGSGAYEVLSAAKATRGRIDPVAHAVRAEKAGAGEILLTAVDREGTGAGFDLELVRRVASAVRVPLIAHGGASSTVDLVQAVTRGGAAAAAAGSLFVYRGARRGVLLSYPSEEELLTAGMPMSTPPAGALAAG